MTLVLLGDVFYTKRAIERIVSYPNGIHVFGRPGTNLFTGSPYGEIFAFSFDRDGADEMLDNADRVSADAKRGGRGKIWELYRSLAGFSLDESRTDHRIFVPIHDFTDDIDSPQEDERVAVRYSHLTSSSFVTRGYLYCVSFLRTPHYLLRRFFRRWKRRR
ncbi:MAG: hypothetical protein MK106_15565 [Mariniblastus sp.]|nr:hypothetical protein [Mariniblastus sp.]